MKFKVIEESKNSLVFELEGEEHSYPGLLCWALLKDPRVELAVYEVDHPLIGVPRLFLRTKNKKPVNALKDATEFLDKEFREFKKQLEREIKKSQK